MRHSPLRHPLAILRQIIGLGQKGLGDLVGRSPRTIQSIELGRHALSEELAHRISHETGASYAWLMKADPQAEPWVHGPAKLLYRKDHFEITRALLAAGKEPTLRDLLTEEEAKAIMTEDEWQDDQRWKEIDQPLWSTDLPSEIRTMLAALEAASRVGRSQLALHRISNFADALAAEFGQSYNTAFLDRYTNVLNESQAGVDEVQATLRKNGDIFWSPFAAKDQWQRGKTVMIDIATPEEMLQKHGVTREDVVKLFPEFLKRALKEVRVEAERKMSQPSFGSTNKAVVASPESRSKKKTLPRR